MMRLWREEYTRPVRRGPSTAMSVVVHGTLIVLAVIATNPPPSLMSLWELANRIYYIAPPSRIAASDAGIAQLKYAEFAPIGPGSGFARSPVPTGEPNRRELVFGPPGDLGTELFSKAESHRVRGSDSVFSVVDVDSAVTTDPTSAAPQYPEALRKLGVEGFVQVRYVVDSTGLADPSSLEVVSATRFEFAMAVRSALPGMHFNPARIGVRRVRQLVVQDFNFRIEKPKVDSVVARKPPTR